MDNIKALYEVRAKRLAYQRWKLKVEVIRTKLEYPAGSMCGEKSGSPTNVNTIEYTQAEYFDTVMAMDKAKETWEMAEARALTVIAKLTDPVQTTVLQMRFIDFMPFDKIATAIGYSERQVIRINLKAIKKIKRCH